MAYEVEFTREAIDDLQRLDRAVAQRVLRRLKWLSENFDNVMPEPLAGEFKGLFKLRVGSHRLIYEIRQDERILTVHLVGHRKDIYKQR